MNKLKELVEELKRITNLSQPNIKYKDQMDVIEALEAELEYLSLPLNKIPTKENCPNTWENIMSKNTWENIMSKSDIVDQSLNEVIKELQQEEIEQNDPLVQKFEESQLTEEEKEQLDKLEFERALAKRNEQAAIENEKSRQRGRKKKEQQPPQE